MEDTNLMRISLHQLRFFGQYGLFAAEQKWTTELLVDIHLTFDAGNRDTFKLSDTIDYQKVYEVAAVVFSKSEELIENLATRLKFELRQQFPQIMALEIKIRKSPILGGPVGSVSISLSWTRPA